jgi:hypothetical protein
MNAALQIEPEFLSRKDAAAYLKSRFGLQIGAQWLAKAAVRGDGPVFHKSGKAAVYAPGDLSTWARARMSPAVSRARDLAEGVPAVLQPPKGELSETARAIIARREAPARA